jgi:hypothetical protein
LKMLKLRRIHHALINVYFNYSFKKIIEFYYDFLILKSSLNSRKFSKYNLFYDMPENC